MKDSDSDTYVNCLMLVITEINSNLHKMFHCKRTNQSSICLPKQLLPQVRVVSFAYLATEEQTGSFGVK